MVQNKYLALTLVHFDTIQVKFEAQGLMTEWDGVFGKISQLHIVYCNLYCDERVVCLSVCLTVHKHIPGNARPNFIKLSVQTYIDTALARSSSIGVVTCCAFPLRSHLCITSTNRRRE